MLIVSYVNCWYVVFFGSIGNCVQFIWCGYVVLYLRYDGIGVVFLNVGVFVFVDKV